MVEFENAQQPEEAKGSGGWARQGCRSGAQAARPPAGTARAGLADPGAVVCVCVCLSVVAWVFGPSGPCRAEKAMLVGVPVACRVELSEF